ncbi:MAG TPA: HNH endonuclease signature motif containing protein, partial [Streptosporangiaceae bacterium]|nr:HNH endonuclease signature motif containing protein [Streptosporangiaceae bacterium]
WLTTMKITPIETTTCAHRYQSTSYQPSPALRHRIKIRSPRCGFPGCRRPARRCDDDHTIPHHKGGRTCECNLYPLCRHHHQCKQTEGWHLTQPRPGTLIWTTPNGRTYTTTPEPYPV